MKCDKTFEAGIANLNFPAYLSKFYFTTKYTCVSFSTSQTDKDKANTL